jgi:TRAP transporter TAXI family solute receptor
MIVLTFLGVAYASAVFTTPAPPKVIRFSTGNLSGSYHEYGQQYAEQLVKQGIKTDIQESAGSVENLQRLLRNETDVALCQGGIGRTDTQALANIRSIASVYYEPIWLFYRSSLDVKRIEDLRNKRVSIGSPGSGIETVAKLLIELNGLDESQLTIRRINVTQAIDGLIAGDLDAAFIVTAADNKLIRKALSNPKISLFNFRRGLAYTRYLAFLQPITLTTGSIDLRQNLPDHDINLLSTSAVLVSRRDLHHTLVTRILRASRQIHNTPSPVSNRGEFPSLRGISFPPLPMAESYFLSGESWLSQMVPYSLQRLFYRWKILLIPMLTVWLPAAKLLPMIYQARVKEILKLHYRALSLIETDIGKATSLDHLKHCMEDLDSLQEDLARYARKVPLEYRRDLYHWRVHFKMVYSELQESIRKGEVSATD